MNLSIDVNNENCPFGEPVAVIDNDTGQILSCHKTVIDAQKARALAAGVNPLNEAALYSTPPTVTW